MRLPIIPVLLLMLVAVAADFYIWRVIKKHSQSKVWPTLHIAISALFMAVLVAVLLMPYRTGDNDILKATMWMLFSYLSVYLSKIIFIIFCLISSIPNIFKRRSWRAIRITGAVVAVSVFVAMWWGALINRYNIDVNNVDISGGDVPVGFDGFTIAQISDLHVGTFGNNTAFLSKLVNEINGLRPDMIVFTGDIVNRRTDELLPFVNTLSRLKAPYGVYSILGNHDYGDYSNWPSADAKEENLEMLKELQAKMGWQMLNNATQSIVLKGDTLQLVGVENVGDPPFHTYGSLNEAYPTLADSSFKILLSHNPAHWERDICNNDTASVALTLSGHTHAMQIEIAGLSPARLRYKHWGGFYNDNQNHRLYVNIGAGTVGFPARIGATPEITLFTLHHNAIPSEK